MGFAFGIRIIFAMGFALIEWVFADAYDGVEVVGHDDEFTQY